MSFTQMSKTGTVFCFQPNIWKAYMHFRKMATELFALGISKDKTIRNWQAKLNERCLA